MILFQRHCRPFPTPRVVKTTLVSLFIISCLGLSSLSQPAAAQAGLDPSGYLNAARIVTTSIDRYEMGAVWEAASPVMKSSTPQDRFVSNIAQKRAQLGSILGREWISVTRVPLAANEGNLPAGQYVSVRFRTTGQNGRQMDEVISFRQDADAQWRLVGYSLN